jgi:hypothetical protein
MNRNRFEKAWAAWPAQRKQPKTAVERIDEFLERDRAEYDRERLKRIFQRPSGRISEAVPPGANNPAQSG